MPRGVYIRTEQAKRNIGLAGIGRTPWNKGKTGIYSEETLRKISEHNRCKGKKNPQLTEANKKRIYTPELRKKMSLRQKGENGSNWRGGIGDENIKFRNSIETRLWREAVFSRDNWTCQKCKKRGYKLHSHHILPFSLYPEHRRNISNGVTLCIDCHNQYHKKVKLNNSNHEQFSGWLSSIS